MRRDNWLVQRIGVVPVGFGLHAPAAVYAVGPALVLREVVQWSLGRTAAVSALVERSREAQRLEKELGDAGIKLSSVATDPGPLRASDADRVDRR